MKHLIWKLGLASTILASSLVLPARTIVVTPAPDRIKEASSTMPVLPASLKRICSCESNWDPGAEPRQFAPDGSPLEYKNYGKNGSYKSSDWGSCQINDVSWAVRAEEMGLDYKNSQADNYALAIAIWNEQGDKPWLWSRSC